MREPEAEYTLAGGSDLEGGGGQVSFRLELQMEVIDGGEWGGVRCSSTKVRVPARSARAAEFPP